MWSLHAVAVKWVNFDNVTLCKLFRHFALGKPRLQEYSTCTSSRGGFSRHCGRTDTLLRYHRRDHQLITEFYTPAQLMNETNLIHGHNKSCYVLPIIKWWYFVCKIMLKFVLSRITQHPCHLLTQIYKQFARYQG